MPYKIVAAKGKRGFFVETEGTHKKHSSYPLSIGMAKKQMGALYLHTKDIMKKPKM